MLSAARIIVSLIFGYAVTVAMAAVTTFAIVHLRRDIVLDGGRLSTRYKLLQDALWILHSAIGGYIALLIAGSASPTLAAALLASILIATLWRNPEEARQLGLLHILAASCSIIIGIGAAYYVRALPTR